VMRSAWGAPLDLAAVEARLARKDVKWLWAVHCETSTGVLNDLAALQAICRAAGVKLCLDSISSIGTLEVDLREVYLASCVSGKALGSFPGLSMVFYDTLAPHAPDALPRYLDLRYYAAQSGVAFTTSTNLVYALQAALACASWPQRFARIGATTHWLRRKLRAAGFAIVAADEHAAPGVLSIALDSALDSSAVGMRLRQEGFLVGYESSYLVRRNWIQIALMGAWSDERLETFVATLSRVCALRGQEPCAAESRREPNEVLFDRQAGLSAMP
jgi:aspartate aminotransferase-like enzyme